MSNIITPGTLLPYFNTVTCPPGYVQTSATQCTPIYNVINPGTLLPSNNYPAPRILSSSMYTNSVGNTHIVGEVINQSPITVQFVKVIVTFYNAYNQVVGTDHGYTDPHDLAPYQRAPFDIIILSVSIPMNRVSTYALSVTTS